MARLRPRNAKQNTRRSNTKKYRAKALQIATNRHINCQQRRVPFCHRKQPTPKHWARTCSSAIESWTERRVDLAKHNSGLKLIPQFTGQNWEEFRRKLGTQFTIMNLDTFLHSPPDLTNRIDMRNDKLAAAQICMRLSQAQFKQVSTCSTANDIWTRLRHIYEETAQSKASNLFVQFINYQKKPSQSMKSDLDKHVELYHDLRVYEIEITELALCAKTLDGLPDTYQQIKAAARASQVTTIPTLTNMLVSAKHDEKRVTTNSFPRVDINAMNMQTQENRQGQYCTRWWRSTHNNSQCWLLHPQLREKSSRPQSRSFRPSARRFNRHQNTRSPRQRVTMNANEAPERASNYDNESFSGFHTTTNQSSTPMNQMCLIDSGANVSMTNNRNILQNYKELKNPIGVTCSNGEKLNAYGIGSLRINNRYTIAISVVLFIPELTKTLLATKSFTDQGFTIIINDALLIKDQSGNTIITSKEINGLHYIDMNTEKQVNTTVTMELAHRRLGHASSERLRHTTTATTGLSGELFIIVWLSKSFVVDLFEVFQELCLSVGVLSNIRQCHVQFVCNCFNTCVFRMFSSLISETWSQYWGSRCRYSEYLSALRFRLKSGYWSKLGLLTLESLLQQPWSARISQEVHPWLWR